VNRCLRDNDGFLSAAAFQAGRLLRLESATAKPEFKSVDAYIASQTDEVQIILGLVQGAIRKALPGCDEVISYSMLTYKLGGEAIIYFAAWKRHYSIYPASAALVAEFTDQLAECTINKNTLRFSFSDPVPVKLIARIAKYRAREVADREKKIAASASRRQSTRKTAS
jgi:uncharacterized protein YdhG (YjbR/CyaY superfamily)